MKPNVPLVFSVRSASYDAARHRLEFTAHGRRGDCTFTVVTDVVCLKQPATPENIHLVALVRLTEMFRLPSASGRD
jgi:hypothetical protein